MMLNELFDLSGIMTGNVAQSPLFPPVYSVIHLRKSQRAQLGDTVQMDSTYTVVSSHGNMRRGLIV